MHNEKIEGASGNEYWLNPVLQKIGLFLVFLLSITVLSKAYFNQYFDQRIVTDKTQKIVSNIRYLMNPVSLWDRNAELIEQKDNIKNGSPYAILSEYVGDETIDVYNYNQIALLNSDLNWSPRPVFQSYSTYTGELLKINESHIISNGSHFVLFNNETIDGRLPLMDDNLWVRQLLHRYKYVASVNQRILLEKKKEASVPELKELSSEVVGFDQAITIPNTGNPVYLSAEIEESLLGKMISLLYKPPTVNMLVTKADGSSSIYRIIPDMLTQPTLISPLLDNNQKVAEFLYGKSNDTVINVRFIVSDPYHYKSKIKVKLYEDMWPQNNIISEISNIVPSSIVSEIPLEVQFVYDTITLFFHPNAEIQFDLNGQKTASVVFGMLPEVKDGQKSNGVNLYWEAERNGGWDQFGILEYTPQLFTDHFAVLEAVIPDGVTKIRLRIDGGNNLDTSYDWAVIKQILIE